MHHVTFTSTWYYVIRARAVVYIQRIYRFNLQNYLFHKRLQINFQIIKLKMLKYAIIYMTIYYYIHVKNVKTMEAQSGREL